MRLFKNVCTQEAGGNHKKNFQRILYVQREATASLAQGHQLATVHAKHQSFRSLSVHVHRDARVAPENAYGHRVVGGEVQLPNS